MQGFGIWTDFLNYAEAEWAPMLLNALVGGGLIEMSSLGEYICAWCLLVELLYVMVQCTELLSHVISIQNFD